MYACWRPLERRRATENGHRRRTGTAPQTNNGIADLSIF
jgi:hypothetical protein